ncbi:Phosphatidylinositol N-acetylglucosaminyltransferase GPI2 subunit [Tolypocladium capitatum]|uniref:Phosphatidylinositol N-acetylglucosaminyltransferase GPI2 subunit n=1 Tax=Tolypocladium capitatum TaxID=45235 RepID=A0A2K3PZ58_9HYPO|nr:Phosphatidylinositol N-acetylglucosaminyltransferase GPI2 subunit [Tolypocladium capitatum]
MVTFEKPRGGASLNSAAWQALLAPPAVGCATIAVDGPSQPQPQHQHSTSTPAPAPATALVPRCPRRVARRRQARDQQIPLPPAAAPARNATIMPSPTDDDTPFPALSHASTFSAFGRSHLSPHDATVSPPLHRRRGPASPERRDFDARGDGAAESLPRMRHMDGERSRSRRRKRMWKKLMWATFLENLQRNPRLKPYDFWPLVADSTVILQHVCSVIIFIVCFVGIFQERVSPVSAVSWSSVGTLLGWLLWERWVSEEDEDDELNTSVATVMGRSGSHSLAPSAAPSAGNSAASSTTNLNGGGPRPLRSTSTTSLASQNGPGRQLTPKPSREILPEDELAFPSDENRIHQRLGTIKSALLIYCTLLGLSPILKSLTRSTSSDSIWAMSFWLLAINIFFFDYSGGVGAKFPASLSTNAALMASTVLASRLPSTKQVFSLTLFSIEVFGLFPVFRRHVRHRSWRYHVLLAVLLVLGAGLGVGMVLGDAKAGRWPWKSGIVGMVVGVVIAALATGGCSWWLIGLQKYKNEIRGPWDPARPIIMSRTRWDDR